MKDKILHAMEQYFGQDKKRINHAKNVLAYAEQLLATEPGDQEIVVAAAILHDIGIHAAEKKHGSTAGKFQQIEGPPIAKHILEQLNFPKKKLAEVLAIIAHHHTPGVVNTPSFKVLYDADWLVNLKDEVDLSDKPEIEQLINKVFLTTTGRKIAQATFLAN